VGFKEIFDGVLRREEGSAAQRGEEVEQRCRISFEEAFFGAERRLEIERHFPCSSCGGSGEVAVEPLPCSRCGGAGQVKGRRGHMIFSRSCESCDGTGLIRRRGCGACAGEGRVPGGERLEVRIPAGVKSGRAIRLRGGGHAGRRGGAPGDLVLLVDVDAHPRFRREDDDLHCIVPVSIVEAALGGHVEVATPDGVVAIELPAGTQGGQRFRLRKRGMPRLGEAGRGDLYAEVRVSVPTVADDLGRAQLQAFAEAHPQSREALRAALERVS
jgi:molecular chaperone DnaJ